VEAEVTKRDLTIAVSHPTGNRNLRAVLDAFQNKGWLERFHTSIASPFAGGPVGKRHFGIPWRKVKVTPHRELLRLTTSRFRHLSIHQHEKGYCSVDQVYRSVDRSAARYLRRRQTTAVYAYEDGALHTFEIAKALGVTTCYELPIAYFGLSQQLLKEEALRYPEWEPTLVGTQDSPEKLQRKRREMELADIIVCPSNFVANSIPKSQIGAKPISVIPYGTDAVPSKNSLFEHSSGERLRLLFVGALTQRKGLADLFECLRHYPQKAKVELHLIGPNPMPLSFYQNQGVDFIYHGALPREQILKQMSRSDVLILPSIVEGRALVQLEALSQGLPLIISRNTGGEDLIVPEETGFLIDIRRPGQIAEILNWFLNNRQKLPMMRMRAREHAAKISWQAFEQKLTHFIDTLFPG